METSGLMVTIDEKTQEIISEIVMPPIYCVSFKGGGVRGAGYVKVIDRLEKYHILSNIRFVSGSSVGAIPALAIALGCTAKQAEKKLYDLSIESFIETPKSWSITPNFMKNTRYIYNILVSESHSLTSGKTLSNWLKQLIKEQLHNENATFKDLADAIQQAEKNGEVSPYKYLFVPGTKLSNAIPQAPIYSHETTPDMPLERAVTISASFPGVFEPVKWDGHSWVDGGLKDNLPTTIFDKRKYLPAGYDFNEQGLNPGTLAIMIVDKYEYDELNGIENPSSIDTIAEFSMALYNASSQTIDFEKLREGYLFLPLPDCNIGTLQFSIDLEGKINLMTAAEKATQEFLENHFSAAYASKKAYKNTETFLEAQSLTELTTLIEHYETMKQYLSSKNHAMLYRKCPSIEEIDQYIVFLKAYLISRIEKKPYPDLFPNHVNLIPVHATYNYWHFLIRQDMESRLEGIKQQIAIVNKNIDMVYADLPTSKQEIDLPILHSHLFQNIQHLTGLKEYLNLLEEEKRDLEIKLHLPTKPREKNDSNYAAFSQQLTVLLKHNKLSPALKAILQNIDLYHPQLLYRSRNESDNIIFSLDLRHPIDRQLYVIGACLYLTYYKNYQLDLFKKLFEIIFPSSASLPKSMSDLSTLLKISGIDLLIAAYRIEELLNFFQKTELHRCTMDIDYLFGTVPISTYKKKQQPAETKGNVIGLSNIFKPTIIHHSHAETSNSNNNNNNSSGKMEMPKGLF